MAFLIWTDDDGKEIAREKKGRGRPPRGCVRKADGNFYAKRDDQDKTVYYIITDARGKVISKKPKGRGRPKPGFVKRDGHWHNVSPVMAK